MKEKKVYFRLNLDHLAFYRAWMEGTFDLAYLADRYLETGSNMPAAKRTLKAVQDTLVEAARRAGKHGQARLLMLDKNSLRNRSDDNKAPGIISFEDFYAEKNPNGEFSDREIWEIYEAEYGKQSAPAVAKDDKKKTEEESSARKAERNSRLVTKRISLIDELLVQLSKPPKLTDSIEGWFDETVTIPLINAGLRTLGDFIDLANHKGYLWYQSVPKMGPVRAARLLKWFERHNDSVGKHLTPFALKPRKELPKAEYGVSLQSKYQGQASIPSSAAALPAKPKTASPFAPSESGLYLPPSDLDGSQGRNRAPTAQNRTETNNDYDAIQKWLSVYREPRHKNTQRSYRTTAERLLLWSIFVKHKAFSSLTTTDVIEFKEFLADPKPYSTWVSHGMHPRFHPSWRPFVWRRRPKKRRYLLKDSKIVTEHSHTNDQGEVLIAGLSDDSIKQSITILSGLCSWLVGQGYLDYNPFAGLAKKKTRTEIDVGRSLTKRQWSFVMSEANKLPEDSQKSMRIRFILHFAYSTGLRLTELVNAKTGDISVRDFGDDLCPLILKVIGKGSEPREVVLPRSLLHSMGQYFKTRGIPEDPRGCEPDTPIIAKLFKTKYGEAMTDSALYRVLTEFFEDVAQNVPDQDKPRGKEDVNRLLQASTHWLRHTHGTHAAAYGTSLAVIKKNLGHKSLTTTSIYVQAEERQQAEQMEAFDQAVYNVGKN